MKTIILDTSFLVACAEFGIDYEEELRRIISEKYSIAVIERTFDELDSLVGKGGKTAVNAKLAKAILNQKKVEVLAGKGHVDKLIFDIAKPEIHIVATIDAALKKTLQQKGIGLIVIRQKRYLAHV